MFVQFMISYMLFLSSYYIPSSILYYFDKSNLYPDNKLQSNDNLMDNYRKSYNIVLFNTVVAIIPGIIGMTLLTNLRNIDFTFNKMVIDILLSTLLVDILFYVCHRILHTKPMYKRFHKLHHDIKNPVGFSSLYTSITELYFGNILPVYLPLILLSSHSITVNVWIVVTTLNTIILSHSGYKCLAGFHDLHHEKFNVNYGVLFLMDKIFGTFDTKK